MPYIKTEERLQIVGPSDNVGPVVVMQNIQTPGQLNFALTTVVNAYFKTHGQNYQAINDVIGALEGAKLEFYRRAAAPYENGKITDNGDVY